MPSPINIFSALAEASGFQLVLSPAGRVCEQIIASFGSLMATRSVLESPRSRDAMFFAWVWLCSAIHACIPVGSASKI
jgi:hypothetical protein